MNAIRIGAREIGVGSPCFLAAEIGINHNGDFERATRMVEEAARCGVDAVKFQNYRTEDFIEDRALTYTYRSQGREITESQWDMFKRCEPQRDWLGKLKRQCEGLGLVFFSTPTSVDGVRDLVELGVQLIKNGSDYLTHIPLLEYMGATGIAVVVSTGMADQTDVDNAVAAVLKGPSPLVLLHCTSAYPTRPEDVNLRRMVTLGERYRVPVGFSDHTLGCDAALQAVTLGACMIEKHFTLDRELPGPDHWFSSTPDEMADLVVQVRMGEKRLGRATIEPANSEVAARKAYRLAATAAVDLAAGTSITDESVRFRRPGTGFLPRDLPRFLGCKLLRAVRKGEAISSADLDPSDRES